MSPKTTLGKPDGWYQKKWMFWELTCYILDPQNMARLLIPDGRTHDSRRAWLGYPAVIILSTFHPLSYVLQRKGWLIALSADGWSWWMRAGNRRLKTWLKFATILLWSARACQPCVKQSSTRHSLRLIIINQYQHWTMPTPLPINRS